MSIDQVINGISDKIWGMFLPMILLIVVVINIAFFTYVQKRVTVKAPVKAKNVIGPVAISMGAMVGTGAIIGVLGSIATLASGGQEYFEAIAGWGLIGALIMVPISYIETVIVKVVNKSPRGYISDFLNPTMGTIYAISFIILYVFGFGGFQIQGINQSITILAKDVANITVTPLAGYIVIVLPLLIIVSFIVLLKKHEVFIESMAYMIATALVMYLILILMFVFKTSDYFPIYFNNIIQGMSNPVTAGIGIPIGLIVSLQRIIQTAAPGLGELGMSSLDSPSKPREAGIISLIPSITTIFLAIMVTSYITSYGASQGFIDVNNTSIEALLEGYFRTCQAVGGMYGLITIFAFTILSGLTTLLGSYYYLTVLLNISMDRKIYTYIILIFISGTVAIFGGSLIFDMVDLLLFLVTGINLLALLYFIFKGHEKYKLTNKDKE